MTNTSDLVRKTQKKQRRVNNPLVDIDFVAMEPGENYCDWILLTKQKLKERDNVLLHIKINKVQLIVNHELNANNFKQTNFVIKKEIVDKTLATLSNKIDKWNGINHRRTKASLNRFRDYFRVGKKWYDQTKTKIFGTLFWLSVFQHIQQFVTIDNNHYLLLKIIQAIFKATVKYNNTKAQPIINGGTIIHSPEIHDYLYNINHLLTIKQWIKQDIGHEKAKIIPDKIRETLVEVIANMSVNTSANMSANTSANIYTDISTNLNGLVNDVYVPAFNDQYTYSNMDNIYQINQAAFFLNNMNNNNNNNNYILANYHYNPITVNYGGYRQATYAVSDVRYTPLLSPYTQYQAQYQMVPVIYQSNNHISLLPIPADNPIILFQQ